MKCIKVIDWTFVLISIFSLATASKVTFVATPAQLKNNLTDEAYMRCSVGGSFRRDTASTAEDVHRVMSLFVTRANGQDVASVTATDAPLAFVEPGNLRVTGSVSAVSGEGFIELSWSDPSQMALGQYVCNVTARDDRGHTVVMTSSLEIGAGEPTIKDVIAAMKHHNKINQQEISRLQQCVKPHVGFTATFQKAGGLTLTKGTQAIFDKVIMNTGGAYDSNTGNFTCTTDGMYSFQLHVLDSGTSHGCLQLTVNGAAVSSAFAQSGSWDAASTSAVLDLQQGDVVSAVVCYPSTFTDNNSGDDHVTWGFQSNIFTGHLLQARGCYA